MTPVVIYTIHIGWSVNSAVLFGIAAFTDWFDGYFARKNDTASDFGKIFDPLVDRIFIASIVVALVIIRQTPPLWAVALLVARDIVLMLAGQIVYSKTGKRIPVNVIGKIATGVLMWAVPFIIAGWPIAQTVFLIGLALAYVAAIMYFVDGVKLVREA